MNEPVWRKSSRSGSGGAGGQECVEIADLSIAIGIRDSKAPREGRLSLSVEGFASLVARVKSGELDL
ncbi:DUF397 domain-containing protein [Spirillospora sp. CA-294931]|uniref:DUF397 domain-containing protein n=1 Tax=Spirillospora sp. CA-294931 TaxID=3240042 RepID=UPI003D941739